MLDAATLEAITQEARQAFLDEDAPECLEMLAGGFQELESLLPQRPAESVLRPIFKTMGRAAHSLKGGAGMAGLGKLNVLCHRMEDLFEALELGQIAEPETALALLSMALEEVQLMIELATSRRTDENDNAPSEITLALEEYLGSLTAITEEANTLGDVSDFIRTSLNIELESCLERAEKQLSGSPAQIETGLNLLLEECTLLGQALSCPWLETLGQDFQAQTANTAPVSLLPVAIAEIRRLRSEFLAGGPSAKQPATPEVAPPDPVIEPPAVPVTVEAPPLAPAPPQAVPSSQPLPRQTLRIPLERLRSMSNTVSELLIGHEQLLVYDKQLLQASRNLKQRGQQLIPMREQVESLYDELSITETAATRGNNQAKDLNLSGGFDALEFDSYGAVHTILQRFQELMVQVQEIQEDVEIVERDFQETLIQVRQSLHRLDTELTQSRLVPFAGLAQSFIQPIQKLSLTYGKTVNLKIEGENTLVEATVLDQLRTPLTHLLRNAFDHGLETPPERQALGKPTSGTLTLGATVTSNQVRITVTDDGRGIDLRKVQQKAIALGLTTPERSASESRDKILSYLFSPGFSTAAQVSELSGRGLGLDIVKQLVESLRGTLSLETEWGKGSRFILAIPLTLNILPLLLVRTQQRVVAFPSESIVKILSLSEYPLSQGQIQWQDQKIPVRPLEQILPYAHTTSTDGYSVRPNAVGLVIRFQSQTVVVTVEQIIDERPLVVRALDPITPIPAYLGGCTVLGTGEVIPILIPANFGLLWQEQMMPATVSPQTSRQPTILIIDDSVTVRRTLQRVLGRSGYQLLQCRDGLDAWELLNRQSSGIDLALCDLEMPNMDGFSLLQLIRSHSVWKSLPVVVLTSRENDLHRQRAMNLGATDYLTKPFQPNELLVTVGNLLQAKAEMESLGY
jgi:type IV pili sensor histidine kinase/response regulator